MSEGDRVTSGQTLARLTRQQGRIRTLPPEGPAPTTCERRRPESSRGARPWWERRQLRYADRAAVSHRGRQRNRARGGSAEHPCTIPRSGADGTYRDRRQTRGDGAGSPGPRRHRSSANNSAGPGSRLERDPVASARNVCPRHDRRQPELRHIRSPLGGAATGRRERACRSYVTSTIETRLVQVGLHSDTHAEIRDGVREGELVVANAGSSLRDGDKVRPHCSDASSDRAALTRAKADEGGASPKLVERAVRQIRPLLRRTDPPPSGRERRPRRLVHVPRNHAIAGENPVGEGGGDGPSNRAIRVRDRTSDQLGDAGQRRRPSSSAARTMRC